MKKNTLAIKANVLRNWVLPSAHICNLLRQGAELALVFITQSDILEEMLHIKTSNKNSLDDDPLLIAATRRANRSSLIYWLNETISHPERPVSPYISMDLIQIAREAARLGNERVILTSARTAQSVAWQYWMKIIFQLTEEPDELQILLDISSRSINHFIDGNLLLIEEAFKEIQIADAHDFQFQKREWINKILEGAQINIQELSRKLNYPFDQAHHAAVIWSEAPEIKISLLEEAVNAFLEVSQQAKSLKIVLSTSIIWVWVPAVTSINWALLTKLINQMADVKLTYASGGKNLDGFRKAHINALATQHVLGRLHSKACCICYEQIKLAAIMSLDPDELNHYKTYVLGDLLKAPIILQRTLLSYLECGCNIAETAIKLSTHRNTVIRRLAKAEELLPLSLDQSRIQVGAALEVLKWEKNNFN